MALFRGCNQLLSSSVTLHIIFPDLLILKMSNSEKCPSPSLLEWLVLSGYQSKTPKIIRRAENPRVLRRRNHQMFCLENAFKDCRPFSPQNCQKAATSQAKKQGVGHDYPQVSLDPFYWGTCPSVDLLCPSKFSCVKPLCKAGIFFTSNAVI